MGKLIGIKVVVIAAILGIGGGIIYRWFLCSCDKFELSGFGAFIAMIGMLMMGYWLGINKGKLEEK